MLIMAKIVKNNKIPSTRENLFLFRSYDDITLEIKKEQNPKKITKKKNSDTWITPNVTAKTQFINEVVKIVKEEVEEASKGLHPRFLYIDTRRFPPPNPNPLKIPA